MSSHRRRAALSVGAFVLAALIPKCPLCVAAALSVLGFGASLAPVLRPLAFVVAAAALVLFLVPWVRRRPGSETGEEVAPGVVEADLAVDPGEPGRLEQRL